jgi:hypothetical protein
LDDKAMIEMLIIIWMGITAGWAGGSIYGHRWFGCYDFLPEILFSLPVIFALFPFFGWWSILAGGWTYIFFQSGTWPILPWWKEGVRSKTRKATLKPIADFIADQFNVSFDSEAYAWIYAAMRGFFITLPVGGLGAFTSPLAREIGSHQSHHGITEVLEGAGFGLCVALFFYATH